MARRYERLGVLPLEEVVPRIGFNAPVYRFSNRYNVSMASLRLRCLKVRGLNCEQCGLQAQYFAVERHSHKANRYPAPHLNLYGLDQQGREVMLTRDHYVPLAKGGHNGVSNARVLCERCNRKKSDKMPAEYEPVVLELDIPVDWT